MSIRNVYIKDGKFVTKPYVKETAPEDDFSWRNYQVVLHPATVTVDNDDANKIKILYQATQCASEIKDENSDNVCILGTYTYTDDAVSSETIENSNLDSSVTLHELLYTSASHDVFIEYEHGQQESYFLRDLFTQRYYGLRTSIHFCHLFNGEVSTKEQVFKTFINGGSSKIGTESDEFLQGWAYDTDGSPITIKIAGNYKPKLFYFKIKLIFIL